MLFTGDDDLHRPTLLRIAPDPPLLFEIGQLVTDARWARQSGRFADFAHAWRVAIPLDRLFDNGQNSKLARGESLAILWAIGELDDGGGLVLIRRGIAAHG